MKKQSAGIVVYRKTVDVIEIFLVHPGGPFWAKKDKAAWSIPKGEYPEDEDALSAARREFGEETGVAVPAGELIELGAYKVSSSKVVRAWAVEGDIDPKQVKSNTFEMEWPPKSGQMQTYPEADKAAWFPLAIAVDKIVKGQVPIIEQLAVTLGTEVSLHSALAKKSQPGSTESEQQTSLF